MTINKTTTDLSTLKINYLTQEMYEDALENEEINENELYITPGSGTIDSTSAPTANKIAEFDSTAHMNSTDMTSQEVDDFVDSLNISGTSILNMFYPVGSYYETSDTTFNPNTAWGGTWVLTDGGVLSASPNVTRIESGDQTEKTTTTSINLLTIQHTSRTGHVWVCGMSTVKTSRYTSRIHLDINGADCGGQTTNSQTYTRLTAITHRMEVPIDTPFTVALRLTSQDTGTTASRSAYTNDQLFVSDVPKVTGYCWHRTA